MNIRASGLLNRKMCGSNLVIEIFISVYKSVTTTKETPVKSSTQKIGLHLTIFSPNKSLLDLLSIYYTL